MNKSNHVQQTKDNAIEKYIRLRGTRQHLHSCTLIPTGASPQAFTHKPNKRKRKREKGSCNFPVARRPTARPPRASRASRLSCLAPLVPRACQPRAPLKHGRLSATCASQQRAPLSNVRLSATSSNVASLSQFSSSSSALLPSTHSCASRHVRLSATLLNSPVRAPLEHSSLVLLLPCSLWCPLLPKQPLIPAAFQAASLSSPLRQPLACASRARAPPRNSPKYSLV